MTALRHTGKVAALMVPASQLARLGLPALITLGTLVMLVLAILCWVIASDDRSNRTAQLMLAARGRPALPTRRRRRSEAAHGITKAADHRARRSAGSPAPERQWPGSQDDVASGSQRAGPARRRRVRRAA
jgi:hypothetical protein